MLFLGVLCLSTRWPHSIQQRSGFKKGLKKPEPKKVEGDLAPPQKQSYQAPHSSPQTFGRLLKPFVFTVGFTGCSFASAAIWQYESLKSRVQSYFDGVKADRLAKLRPQKQTNVRNQVNLLWNSFSEGQKTVTWIIAANAIVFCCWKIPSLRRSMYKYFVSDPTSKTVCAPMILSTFSHPYLFQLTCNMLVLWSFSSSAVTMLGREQFIAVYLSAGVISTFSTYALKTVTGRFGVSLGASGAILSIAAAFCTKMPEAELSLIFLPMFTVTAANVLKAIVVIDAAGLTLGWRFFDHASHLGGTMFGIWYALFGHELIWKNRELFVKFWHNLRTRGGPGGGGASV